MTGIAIGTLFTLYVVPSMYMILAAEHGRERQQAEEEAGPGTGGNGDREVCPSGLEQCIG
jgi:hypothetical protein